MTRQNRRINALAEEIIVAVSNDRKKNSIGSGWDTEKKSVMLAARQNHILDGIEGEWTLEEKILAVEQVRKKCVNDLLADLSIASGTGKILVHFISSARKLKILAESE